MITNPTRQRALRGHKPTRPHPRAANTAEHQAVLAWRLTPRDKWITRMLWEHRVLTPHQITALAFPSFRSGCQRLRELYTWGSWTGSNRSSPSAPPPCTTSSPRPTRPCSPPRTIWTSKPWATGATGSSASPTACASRTPSGSTSGSPPWPPVPATPPRRAASAYGVVVRDPLRQAFR